MYSNPSSPLDLIAALDVRNVEAHLTGAIENCTPCATVSGSRTACPASRAAEIRRAAQAADARPHPLTAIEVVDQLSV